MTPAQFDQAILALRSWQAAKSDNIDEILAIACTLRNRVLAYGKTYIQICEAAPIHRPYPDIRHPALIHPSNGLLAAIEGIYKNETPDLTSNHLHKDGALYFGEVMEHQGTGDDFEERVMKQYEAHPLIGRWGVQHFYE